MGCVNNYFTILNADGKFRWYDNEWAYSSRVVDLVQFLEAKIVPPSPLQAIA